MNNETLVALVVLAVAAVALAIPYKFPRAGFGVSLLVVAVGIAVYFDRSADDVFFKDLFDELSRTIGTAIILYGSLWAAIAAVRQWSTRKIADAL